VDAAGNVLVTGAVVGAVGGSNVWVAVYDPDGNELFTDTYDGPAAGSDLGVGATFDPSGDGVVSGIEIVAGQARNVWVRKYAL